MRQTSGRRCPACDGRWRGDSRRYTIERMLKMPAPSAEALRNFPRALAEFRRILPAGCIVTTREALRAYECDGLTAYRQSPRAVLLPEDTAQSSRILAACCVQ